MMLDANFVVSLNHSIPVKNVIKNFVTIVPLLLDQDIVVKIYLCSCVYPVIRGPLPKNADCKLCCLLNPYGTCTECGFRACVTCWGRDYREVTITTYTSVPDHSYCDKCLPMSLPDGNNNWTRWEVDAPQFYGSLPPRVDVIIEP